MSQSESEKPRLGSSPPASVTVPDSASVRTRNARLAGPWDGIRSALSSHNLPEAEVEQEEDEQCLGESIVEVLPTFPAS